MNKNVLFLSLVYASLIQCHNAARILVFIPTASQSHQIVSKGLAEELAKRGHEVVVITTHPKFTKENLPNNLTEIDVSDAGYAAKQSKLANIRKNNNVIPQVIIFFRSIFTEMFESEVNTEQVQALINDKDQKFDLLILEACTKVVLVFSHIFKAPVILISSIGNLEMFTDYTGAATHPLLFPTVIHQKLNNLTLYEKVNEIYKHYVFENVIRSVEKEQDEMLRRNFGPDVPPLRELKKNVAMVFLSEHHLWDHNRPIPPNMVYVGGIYPQRSNEPLPTDIEAFLNASVNGVVYISFGTTVYPSMLPQSIILTILRAISQLPFDVLMKWHTNDLPVSKNVKIFQWVPQSEILRHPKIKLFVTQGGMQSTDDAIAAGVPLIGMPLLGDQWYNAEQYVKLKIGLRVDMESITEEKLLNAINTIVNDESYRRNIVALRDGINDQPQTAMERAVWWSEYVIRHQGAPLLRASSALISTWDYYELDLILALAFCAVVIVILLVLLLYCLIWVSRHIYKKVKTD